jgi:hypothetical protein
MIKVYGQDRFVQCYSDLFLGLRVFVVKSADRLLPFLTVGLHQHRSFAYDADVPNINDEFGN